ncbi:hypothetical protein ARMGADRAFT_1078163 [Armillaria gallica]|uniref:Uncharacterized protein n=1 Tax=Armillaria gallica TaxID=47427 RepID=A0A2H3DNI5_ARMGA|nr:hypothetical protein ARMGADRAFT_1078163 [Armillaria gallica]
MLSRSTYQNSIRRFSSHGVYTETMGDARGMNYRFGKANRRTIGLWAFFAEAYEDAQWMLDDGAVRERSTWDLIASD